MNTSGKSLCCQATLQLSGLESDESNHRIRAYQECTECGLVQIDGWLPIPQPPREYRGHTRLVCEYNWLDWVTLSVGAFFIPFLILLISLAVYK